MSLKSRIEKAESKVLSFNTGVPKWCMKLAEDSLKVDSWRLNSLKGIKKALEREGKELETPVDESRYILTKDQADKYALHLHRNYKNYAHYQTDMEEKKPKAMENLICKIAKIMNDEKTRRRQGQQYLNLTHAE